MSEHITAAREAWSAFVRSRFDACATASLGHTIDELADLELKVVEEQLVYARQQRNKVIGPCRLPSEILGSIFLLARDDWDPSSSMMNDEENDKNIMYSLGWMVLLQTCSLWRQTAIETPQLWCRIPILNIHVSSIPTFLKRSRGLPLSIHVDAPHWMRFKTAPLMPSTSSWLCKSVLRRTESIVFGKCKNTHLQPWLDGLMHPMPLLRTFEVGYPDDFGSDLLVALSRNIFNRSAPNLRKVSLYHVALTWDSALLSHNIVDLSLSFNVEDDVIERMILPFMPSTQEFYAMLSSMKALEALTLQDVFPLSGEDIPAGSKLVLPDGLRLLEVGVVAPSLMDSCIAFFTSLTYPAHARVRLSIEAGSESYINDHLPTLTNIVLGQTEPLPLEMDLDETSISMMYTRRPLQTALKGIIRSYDWPWPPEWREHYHMYPGNRSLYTRFDSNAELSILAHTSLLCLSTIQVMTIGAKASLFFSGLASDWIKTFATAEAIHSIAIPYTSALSLFEAMCEVDTTAGKAQSFILFPLLTTIALYGNPSDAYPQKEDGAMFADLQTTLGVSLVEFLQVRIEKGAAVQKILVENTIADLEVWGRIEDLGDVEYFSR